MAGDVAYLDASAFVKLVVSEPESQALRRALTPWQRHASATLVVTETVRALRRSGNEHHTAAARRLLRALHMIRVDETLLDRAGSLDPADLRTLDAIHLSAALALGSDLGAMFVYDRRLRAAAESYGLEVASPA